MANKCIVGLLIATVICVLVVILSIYCMSFVFSSFSYMSVTGITLIFRSFHRGETEIFLKWKICSALYIGFIAIMFLFDRTPTFIALYSICFCIISRMFWNQYVRHYNPFSRVIKIPIIISNYSEIVKSEQSIWSKFTSKSTPKKSLEFEIQIKYTSYTKIYDILESVLIESKLDHSHRIKSFINISSISSASFIGLNIDETKSREWDEICSKSITEFKTKDIYTKGLKVQIQETGKYNQKSNTVAITTTVSCITEKQYLFKTRGNKDYEIPLKMQYMEHITNKMVFDKAIETFRDKFKCTRYHIVNATVNDSDKTDFTCCGWNAFESRSITCYSPYDLKYKITVVDTEDYNYKNKHISVPIKIGIEGIFEKMKECLKNKPISIKTSYLESVKIQSVLDEAKKIYESHFGSKQALSMKWITICGSKPIHVFSKQSDDIYSRSITRYSPYDMVKHGIKINIVRQFTHNVRNNLARLCEDLKEDYQKHGQCNPLKCPIFKAMKINKQFTEHNIDHLDNFSHFIDGCQQKEACIHGLECKSFISLQNGGHKLSDRCHMKLWRHPPRNNKQLEVQIDLNVHAFKLNFDKDENKDAYIPETTTSHILGSVAVGVAGLALAPVSPGIAIFAGIVSLMRPSKREEKKYNFDKVQGWKLALMEEVIQNGFKYDLCKLCKKKVCPHDVYQTNENTVLCIVKNKMQHPRHVKIGSPLRMDHLLALVLYTAGDCNWDLCGVQRDGEYKKWKWFDCCLYEAIEKLSATEMGKYKLFSGLKNVRLNEKQILSGYFPTYTSSTWDKNVAKMFMGDKGIRMMIEIDETFRADDDVILCDVSWISKFEDESEVLIARSKGNKNNFTLSVLDEQNGIQTISLKKRNS